jgi:hypothetical protein
VDTSLDEGAGDRYVSVASRKIRWDVGPEGPGVPSGTSGDDPHSCYPLVLAVHSARCRTIDSQQS